MDCEAGIEFKRLKQRDERKEFFSSLWPGSQPGGSAWGILHMGYSAHTHNKQTTTKATRQTLNFEVGRFCSQKINKGWISVQLTKRPRLELIRQNHLHSCFRSDCASRGLSGGEERNGNVRK